MTRRILPLIGMALLSGPLAAQTPWGLGPPQIVPIENWVSLIESNGYANGYGLNWTPDAEAVALISRAEYLFITDPSLIGIPNSTFQQQLANNLVDNFGWFNNYWINAGPAASLYSWNNQYDPPPIDAAYIRDNVVNYEALCPSSSKPPCGTTQIVPEIGTQGAGAALTLLLGGLIVLRGRRPARPVV
jgi:hypothetical protein